jgi:hypothetical protein
MITPPDGPSSPQHYAEVAVQPMNIQADLPEAEVTAAFNQANAMGGAGVIYPRSERIAEAKTLLESPQGFGVAGFDVDAGWHGGWPGNVEPGD